MARFAPDTEELSTAALLAPDILEVLRMSPELIATVTEDLHPADLADVAEWMPLGEVPAFLAALPPERAAGVLEYLDAEVRSDLFEAMTPAQAAKWIGSMTPDDRADALGEIDEEHAEDIVEAMPTEMRRETERLLEYDPDSAGGLMTTEFFSAPLTETVEETLKRLRTVARSQRREAMYTIYTVEPEGELRGVLSLRELLAAPEGALIADVAWPAVRHVPPTADREEVTRLISEYDLNALPVVDEHHKLLGVVTVDDVIDAIHEMQTEDVQKLGGMEALDEPYMQISIVGMLKKRAGWLSILMVSEMFTTSALQHFDIELQKLPVLMLFIPLVMSGGGNSGSQATSLITRAMALKEVYLRDWWRVAAREVPSGIALGTILGVIGALRIGLWQFIYESKWTVFGASFGYNYGQGGVPWELVALNTFVALIGIVTFGTLMGSMLPFALRRLGFDPASASAPFVATLVDVTGLIIYFTVALVVLGKYMH